MPKDNRYTVINVLIESGEIVSFQDIFKFISKRVIYNDLGMNWGKFQRIYTNPDLLSLRELLTLARLIGCEPVKLFEIATVRKTAKKKSAKK